MRKIACSVILTYKQLEMLNAEKKRTGKSISELIRDAIDEKYGKEECETCKVVTK